MASSSYPLALPQPMKAQRLVFYCRTTSASTAPRTPRRTCCPYALEKVQEVEIESIWKKLARAADTERCASAYGGSPLR